MFSVIHVGFARDSLDVLGVNNSDSREIGGWGQLTGMPFETRELDISTVAT